MPGDIGGVQRGNSGMQNPLGVLGQTLDGGLRGRVLRGGV